MEDRKPKLLFLTGPTASGKSGLALKLAEELQAEIISADSMQLYRGMDIGTAKPSLEEQNRIPHHFLDILDIEQSYSVFEYQKEVLRLLNAPESLEKTYVIAGGTGLYVKSLLHGVSEKPGEDSAVREKWRKASERKGLDFLKEELGKVDPEYAAIAKDSRRIIRALEVYELSGKTVSEWNRETRGLLDEKYFIKVYGLEWPREILKHRIEMRVNEMLQAGFIREVEKLADRSWSTTARQAIGYNEVRQFLEGKLKQGDLVPLIVKNTSALAKRQMTWFRKEKSIHWFQLKNETDFKGVFTELIKDWKKNG